MKAFAIDSYGDAGQLTQHEFPSATPADGQVIVQIKFTTYNPIDSKLASGEMRDFLPLTFPWIPGADFSGVVVKVGSGVNDLQVGDAVYGYSAVGGSYAEEIAMAAGQIAIKPPSLTYAEAASIALVGQTADQALDAGNLKSGQTVLIHGAAGAVGSIAVQLAHGRGAFVIATGSDNSAEYLYSLGANKFIDYKATPFESVAKDVDVVVDTVGGDTQTRSFGTLKQGGYLVALTQPPSPELAAQYSVHTVMLDTHSVRLGLDHLSKLAESGELKAKFSDTFPLDDVASVWRQLAEHRLSGKIVFSVSG